MNRDTDELFSSLILKKRSFDFAKEKLVKAEIFVIKAMNGSQEKKFLTIET